MTCRAYCLVSAICYITMFTSSTRSGRGGSCDVRTAVLAELEGVGERAETSGSAAAKRFSAQCDAGTAEVLTGSGPFNNGVVDG